MKKIITLLSISLCSAFFIYSCSASHGFLKQRLEQSSAAYRKGDVLKAYALLKNHFDEKELLEATPALKAKYEKLNKVITNALEFLIGKWLSYAEELFDDQDISGAWKYYDDLLRNLPENDDIRNIIEKESQQVREKQSAIRAGYTKVFEDAQKRFASGEISGARENILLAKKSFDEWNLDLPLDAQRLLEECNRRLPANDSTDNVQDGDGVRIRSTQRAAFGNTIGHEKRPSLKNRIKHRKPGCKKKPDSSRQSSTTDRVERAYVLGLRFEKEGKNVKALMAFLRVLKARPGHAGAKAALARLETVRKRLIEKWLKIASEFFAREDLKGAAPYYKKILDIDPGNIRATEGLQMYLRLRQLKKKQK